MPEGWKRVESRSRPGEYVYENTYTEERQAWMPETPAEKPLPEGWRKVESRSYPGEFVYENEFTLDRVAWRPDEPATKTRKWRKAGYGLLQAERWDRPSVWHGKAFDQMTWQA